MSNLTTTIDSSCRQCGLTSAFRSGVVGRKIVRWAGNTPCGTSSVSTIVRYHHVGGGEKDEKGLGVDGRLCCDLVRRRFSSGTKAGTRRTGDSKGDDESSTGSRLDANASPDFPKPAHVTKPESESESKPKPKPRRYPRVHLLGRGQSPVQVTPTSTQIPINTTLATSSAPANPRFPKPPYLSTKYARFIPSYAFTQSSSDSYVLTRSVELFGLPGKTDWIAEMKELAAAVSVRDKVTGLLSRLEWMDAGVRSLKNAAWAEHLAAMQNPRLEKELEQDASLSSFTFISRDLISTRSTHLHGPPPNPHQTHPI
ncbi:hypothetical protein FRC12_005179 [Ceratobasidium sp. 428]|nr:hypothetical protein FRC12_005179 [Ceratobasidium sp. 428]